MTPDQPSPGSLREAREWLTRAERDLQAASNELKIELPLPEISAYHARQAAEKSMKAFLTARSVAFQYTHDLVQSQAQCQVIEPAFNKFQVAAETLTPYATLYRYPGGPLAPPLAEADNALQLATDIVQCVRERL